MFELTGRVAVVTGAGSGIGRGIALALADAGASVLVSDLLLERAEATAALIRERGGTAQAQRADVREAESVQALAVEAVRRFGRLDICVANAGILRLGSVLTLAEADWNETLAVNLTGVFLTVQACAREMVQLGNGGRVIVISSLAAEATGTRWSAYGASKAGVRQAARGWAFDLAAFNITVNSIGPGWIDTPLITDILGNDDAREAFEQRIPLGRVGRADEIGATACWLASDEAAWVTGSYIMIDGGMHDGRGSIDAIQALRSRRAEISGDELLAALDAEAKIDRATGANRRAELGLS
jgi:NAD(P)-dependent dehydrogenase (short-subunit alcohol dehydrogenase family)